MKLFQLDGAKELESVLKELPRQIGYKVLYASARSGGAVVKKEMKARAPYNPKRKKGKHLRDTIRVQKKHRTNDLVLVGPTSEAPHAWLVTHGSGPRKFKKPHSVKLGGHVVKVTHSGTMPSNPYVQDAAEASAKSAFDKMGTRLGDLVEKAALKLAGRYKTSGAASGRRYRR